MQMWRDAASSANRADSNHTADYDTASMRQNEQAALACLDAWCELMSESQNVRISGSDDSARSITELAAYLRAGGALASAARTGESRTTGGSERSQVSAGLMAGLLRQYPPGRARRRRPVAQQGAHSRELEHVDHPEQPVTPVGALDDGQVPAQRMTAGWLRRPLQWQRARALECTSVEAE